MALTYEVLTQPDAATVSVVISGLPSDISAANINTEVIDNKVLLFQICGDDDKVQQELQIPLTQAVDADSCAVKLRKKQGSLTFTAAIIKSCSNGQSHVAEVTESLCALQAPSAPHQSAQHGASSAACANGSAEAAQGPAKQASEVPANPASHSNGKEAESKGGGGAKAEPKDLGIAPVIDARYLSVSMSMGLESLQRKVTRTYVHFDV